MLRILIRLRSINSYRILDIRKISVRNHRDDSHLANLGKYVDRLTMSLGMRTLVAKDFSKPISIRS